MQKELPHLWYAHLSRVEKKEVELSLRGPLPNKPFTVSDHKVILQLSLSIPVYEVVTGHTLSIQLHDI